MDTQQKFDSLVKLPLNQVKCGMCDLVLKLV